MKKSYYKLAKLFHPDRVASSKQDEAKEKFNIIHNAYSILSDATKKRLYDSGSNVLFTRATVAAQWEYYLKPITCDDINNARKLYQGSSVEKNDLIHAFLAGNGSMTYILNNIPFMRVEDENRVIEILKDLMDKEELRKAPIKKIKN